MSERRSWADVKARYPKSAARERGYRAAKEAYEVGVRVRNAREKAGVSQAELARRIGSTQPAIARLEAGGCKPNMGTLSRIADALGLELRVELRAKRRASA